MGAAGLRRPMTNQLSTIGRALQLARAVSCRTVEDIRRTLKAERYDGVEANIGGSLTKQLRAELTKRQAA